tara:strand:- start:4662 stop:5342 length:681 start_codon:yes stop_codon:yes gene_type:complete
MPDTILQLVDRVVFQNLQSMPLGDLLAGMNSQSLRELRPPADPRFHRPFDVDLEGDILEWFDANEGVDQSERLSNQNLGDDAASELALNLAHWCALGEWRCWEARIFLYVEPQLDRDISAAEFLNYKMWSELSDSLANSDRVSYSESVVLDWMSRRQGLGETMEPSEDPRILPTMEAHRSSSDSLFTFLERHREEGYSMLIGREYLEPTSWTLDSSSLIGSTEVET